MKQGAKILGSMALAAGLGVSAWADVTDTPDTPDNPYQAIVARNIFGLREPPPPPSTEPPKAPPPNINLTGIATLGGAKRAMLKIPASPAKPNQPPKGDQFFMLSEGERDGELEVLEINSLLNTVRVKYGDTLSTLDFTNNGVKVAFGPAPGAAPGMPGGVPAPNMNAPGTPGGAIPALPGRTLRLPTPGGGVAQPGGQNYSSLNPTGYQPSPYGGGTALGTLQAGSANVNAAQAANQVNQMPVEHQMIMIEAERKRTEQAVASGMLPPLPPTPLSNLDAPPAQPTPTQPNQMRRFPLRAPGLPQVPPPGP